MNGVKSFGDYKFRSWTFKLFGHKDKPLFRAADVAMAIDYSNGKTGQMINYVDNSEKFWLIDLDPYNVSPHYSKPGGNHGKPQWFLTYEGMLEVLMQSRKPVAKAMKFVIKQVMREITAERGLGWEEQYLTENDVMWDEETQTMRVMRTDEKGEPYFEDEVDQVDE